MDGSWNESLWRQLGAAIDMLQNAVVACPEDVWHSDPPHRAFWYLTYHTLFFLDLYTFGAVEGFAPPAPFTLGELDPRGVLPERIYRKEELIGYLAYCRDACGRTLLSLTEEKAARMCVFGWGKSSYGELILRNLRHVQHHTAQLNWILRERTNSAPGWIG
jgi:DinB superfamily